MDWKIIPTFFVLFSASKSFTTIRLISDAGITKYDLDKAQNCFVSDFSDSEYFCPSHHRENSWDLFQDGQLSNFVLSQTDGEHKLYSFNDGQLTEIDAEIKVEFVDNKSDSLGTTEQKVRKGKKMKFQEIYNYHSN